MRKHFFIKAVFAISLAVLSLTTGCRLIDVGGGSDSSNVNPTPVRPSVLIEDVQTIAPGNTYTFGTASRPEKLIVPVDPAKSTVHVTFRLFERQFDEIVAGIGVETPLGLTVTIPWSELANLGSVSVILPMPDGAPYDATATMVMIRSEDGGEVAIPAERHGANLIATVPSELIVDYGEDIGGLVEFKLFSAFIGTDMASPLVTQVKLFKGTNFTDEGVPSLKGKRVAVVVHGFTSSLEDMKTLGNVLANTKPKDNIPYYDAVIGFEYTSNSPLVDIGTRMANEIAPHIRDAREVDLYAHSMGNLISRFAMQPFDTTKVPDRLGTHIKHYVSLGGPHIGLPFAKSALVLGIFEQTLLRVVGYEKKPCIEDMLTKDMVSDGKPGPSYTGFLDKLNLVASTSNGLDYNTLQAYSISGTKYNNYMYGAGHVIHLLYQIYIGKGIKNDGLIAEYSAQSTIPGLVNIGLAKISKTWKKGPTPDVNHSELVYHALPISEITNLISSW
ncbi:MAG: hypothetical protein WA705_31730 [Candidatus Ozemobacteraceae bacterium]